MGFMDKYTAVWGFAQARAGAKAPKGRIKFGLAG
jgi:hypothetical protein